MSGWFVYGLTVIGRLNEVCSIVCIVTLFAVIGVSIVFFLMKSGRDDDEAALCAKWNKRLVVVFLLCGMIYLFVPTGKELAAIYLIPKIVNNEQVQQVPDNALKLLNLKMEEWIEETAGVEGEK